MQLNSNRFGCRSRDGVGKAISCGSRGCRWADRLVCITHVKGAQGRNLGDGDVLAGLSSKVITLCLYAEANAIEAVKLERQAVGTVG